MMAKIILYLLAGLAFIDHAASIRITYPDSTPVIINLSQPNTITWDTVTSDPKTALIRLTSWTVFPPYELTIAESVNLADGEYTYGPITDVVVPSGRLYAINFMRNEGGRYTSIIAQSHQFEIVQDAVKDEPSATNSANLLPSATSSGSTSSKSIITVAPSTFTSSSQSQPTTEDDPELTGSQLSVTIATSTGLSAEPTTSNPKNQSTSAQTSASIQIQSSSTPTPTGVVSSGSILGGRMDLSAAILIMTTIAILLQCCN